MSGRSISNYKTPPYLIFLGGIMKRIILTVLLLLSFCFISTAQAEVQYLGKYCFELTYPGMGAISHYLDLEFLSYGTKTFPIDGNVVTTCYDMTFFAPAHGSATVEGFQANSMKISLTAGATECRGFLSSSYSISLDLQTLTGTFTLVTTRQTSPPILETTEGTIKLEPCFD